MRERSNSLAELLSLSSSSSGSPKRVLTRLYCCVISALSKSVLEVMVVGGRAGGGGGRACGVLGVRRSECGAGKGVQRAEWSENAAGGLEREDRRGDELLRGDKCVKKLTGQSGQVQEDLCL